MRSHDECLEHILDFVNRDLIGKMILSILEGERRSC